MPSIISGSYGAELWTQYLAGERLLCKQGGGRYSRIFILVYKTKFGGLKFTCTVNSEPTSHRTQYKRKMQASRVNREAFMRMIHRLTDLALIESRRMDYAEAVARVAKPFETDQNFLMAIEAEENRIGKDSRYDLMSVEDAEHWQSFLHGWLASNGHSTSAIDLHAAAEAGIV